MRALFVSHDLFLFLETIKIILSCDAVSMMRGRGAKKETLPPKPNKTEFCGYTNRLIGIGSVDSHHFSVNSRIGRKKKL